MRAWILILTAGIPIIYIWIWSWLERRKMRKSARAAVLWAVDLLPMNPGLALEVLGRIHENGYKLEDLDLDDPGAEQICKDHGPWEDVT